MGKRLELLLSIPISLYVNVRLFGIMGFKLPIYVHYKTKIGSINKGNIYLSKFSRGGVRIGFDGTDGIKGDDGRGLLDLGRNSKLIFRGRASFGRNTTIRNYGNIEIGENFVINCNNFISVHTKLSIGDDFMGAWNVKIMDSDNHTVYYDGVKNEGSGTITIGNHVWICAFADILKNAYIGNNCIVGYKSLVNKKFKDDKVLVAGIPARIIRKNVEWKL